MKTQKALVTIALLTCCSAAKATFVAPTEAPIDRLMKNTTAYLTEHPDNAQAYYTLARIHYLAFAQNSASISAFDRGVPPTVAPDWQQSYVRRMRLLKYAEKLALKQMGLSSDKQLSDENVPTFEQLRKKYIKQLEQRSSIPGELTQQQLIDHAGKALTNFQKAIELDPKNALYNLGLASLLEQYVEFLRDLHEPNVPEPFRAIILDKAIQTYYTAYSLAIKKDLKTKYRPLPGLNVLVSYEAATGYLRLAKLQTAPTNQTKSTMTKLKKSLAKLENIPKSRVVTPIIFSLKDNNCLSDLLAQNSNVSFDLDGDNIIETVTWWIFFENGYNALEALDDNRDGQLAGAELKGIEVWVDKNSNAISEPQEVTPIENLPILSIATTPTATDGISPTNPKGLTMTNSRNLPTYDWTIKTHARH